MILLLLSKLALTGLLGRGSKAVLAIPARPSATLAVPARPHATVTT